MIKDDETPVVEHEECPPPLANRGTLSRKGQVLLTGARGTIDQVRQEEPDPFRNFSPEDIDFLRERLALRRKGWNLKSIPYKGGITIVVAKIRKAKQRTAALLTDQLILDVALNSGYRFQYDEECFLVMVYPSKRLLVLLAAVLLSADKAVKLIQEILS